MAFYHSKGFKYAKNFIIGVGAALVMMGALGKINNWTSGDILITVGLVTEALLFLMLGVIPPEKDYYWEKLYPGLDKANGNVQPLVSGGGVANSTPLDGKKTQEQLEGMLNEMRGMSKSLGSLKALQEVDFSKTGEQIKAMDNFYAKLNLAMQDMATSADGVKQYKDNLNNLNKNLSNLNTVYGNMLNAMNARS